ncbi:MAG: glycoside hydrolase family 127 protein [Rubripirellula sp.]|nr:glycoside hydrolase family 127 protein [Rubripirellula sp.]
MNLFSEFCWIVRRCNRLNAAIVCVALLVANSHPLFASDRLNPDRLNPDRLDPDRARADRPNIVLIMADDMGYTDIGCYGSEIKTPVLDSLATGGLRYTQFYNTSRCCPTRASLLTGLYSHQAGIGLMTGDRGYDAYRGDLNRKCVTIAEALRPSGYRNYMSGKWHVTRHVGPKADNSNWPLQRGFERFYGTITGAGSFFDPATLCRGNTYITPVNDTEYQPEEFYYTDAISDNATRYVADHLRDHPDEPFFLYVAYTSAHWPMHAPQADIAKYEGVYNSGYESIRNARYEKAIAKGVIRDQWAMSKGETWENFPHQDWDIRCMQVYAAMVDRMDQGIGRIVDQLEQAKALDNTIVIYLQDNGGCAEGYGRADNADKRDRFDFQPFGPDDLQNKIWPPMQTRDGRWVRTGPSTMPGGEDTFVAYGTGWANTSNTPFRGYKHDGYEGGISTPFIVHWPAGIPREHQGGIVNAPAHLIDLMPTLVDAADADYPKQNDGQAIQPMEGVSLIPSMSGSSIDRQAPIGFEHHGNLALRDGRWKIVSAYRRDQPTKWELYDMEQDRTELNDLAAQEPARLEKMVAQWQAWANRVGVQPWPFQNKRSKPKQQQKSSEATNAASDRTGMWNQSAVKRFHDNFNAVNDFLGPGLTRTAWDGLIGTKDPAVSKRNATADRVASADGKLWLQSTNGRYQEPWQPLGPFLFKKVTGDFRATVEITDYQNLSFNNGGIMARAATPEAAGKGEDWVSIDYFPIYGGIYARMADDNRRREPANNGQGKNADKHLRLERVGNQFFLSHSPDGVTWTDLPDSPFMRDDLSGVPLQVGLFQATYSATQGQVGFDNFTLEQLPPVEIARVISPLDETSGLPRNLSLNWIPGHSANFHDVYLGTSKTAVATATRQSKGIYRGRIAGSTNAFKLDSLDDDQIYYWRIDEISDSQTHQGATWSFQTYDRIIANFEETARPESRHDQWKLASEGNISRSSDFPHSGQNALQLNAYRDRVEATMTFDGNQDWDRPAFGFRTLQLSLKGDFDNEISEVYVALEDNDWTPNRAVVYLGSDEFNSSKWISKNIDLHEFAKNNPAIRLDSIRKLSIDVVGRGSVSVDDISIQYASPNSPPRIQPDQFVDPVPFNQVRVTGGLWRERMEVNRMVSLPHVWGRCETSVTGNGQPSKRLDNFRKAGGLLDGPFTGTYFNDSDVYKIIEGTANSLQNHSDAELEAYTDKVIDWIAAAQWDDGYLFTFYSLPKKQPERRWKNIGGQHELYCAGHLIEAAVAYREATGKDELFNVAVRFADLICDTFRPGKIETAPGHQEIELALLKLYDATGEQRYKQTAKFFIDQRGNDTNRRLYGTYSQDHVPFVQQTKGVGHSVRATYLFAAATDIARLDGNEAYANALFRLWDNIVNRKMYLTGGIGQPGGPEGFAGDYQLGNGCYAETCSGIGFAMWNHRMHQLTGEVKYADLIERTFLNNTLSSLSVKGNRHYYTNPLTTGGRERWEWPGHDCACCPSNLVRLISSIGGYTYSHDSDTIQINQFMESTAEVTLDAGKVSLIQKTDYPWDGKIDIEVNPSLPSEFQIKLRIPGWARDQPIPGNLYQHLPIGQPDREIALTVNGESIPVKIEQGYVTLTRRWTTGDAIQIDLPMPVRRVIAHPNAIADKGLVALERGPVVYCAEFCDNDFSANQLELSDSAKFEIKKDPDLLDGAVTLTSGKMKFIPYYLYANRGPGWMRVWMPRRTP